MRKSHKTMLALGILILGAIFISGNLSIGVFTVGSGKPTNVYIPLWDSAFCLKGATQTLTTYDMSDATYSSIAGSHYHAFYCKLNTEECNLKYDQEGFLDHYYICTVDVSVDERDVLDNPNKYTCISDTWGSNNVYRETDFNYNSNFWTNKEKVVVISNDKFIGELEEGDAIVKIMGQVYNLQSLSGDNYATSSIGTCDVDYLTNAATYILEDREEAERKGSMSTNGVVHFDNSISVISGARIIPYTVNIIEYKNTWVYVRAVGELCEIKKADNGDYFADCRDAIYDEEIICRPSTVGCSVDGRTKGEAEGASCSWYSGVPGKTYPDGKDNICKWKCVDGKLEKYDCKKQQNCAGDEYWDYEDGCVKIGGTGDVTIDKDLPEWLIPLLVIFAALLLITPVLTYLGLRGKK